MAADTSAATTRTRTCLETKSVTRKTLEVHAASVHEFERLVEQQQCETFRGDRPTESVHEPAILGGPPGLERQGAVGKYLLRLSDFLAAGQEPNFSEPPCSRKRKAGVAKPLETTAPSGRLDRPDRGCVQSRRYVGSCAHPVHVRNQNREEQNGRGGLYDRYRFRSMTVDRASFQHISAPTTFEAQIFNFWFE